MSFWLEKQICPNTPLARGAAAALPETLCGWKMHNFTLPTGQKPHTHNTQSGATSVMPTGQRSGLSVLLMHCTSQTLPARTHPNPAHAPFPSIRSSSRSARTDSPCPQDLVWDSFHFFPDSAPFTLITSCSWQIPLSNLPTTALLSPFPISTYHTPSTASSPLFICCHAAPFPPHIIQTPRFRNFRFLSGSPAIPYLQAFLPVFTPLSKLPPLSHSLPWFSLTSWLPSHACTHANPPSGTRLRLAGPSSPCPWRFKQLALPQLRNPLALRKRGGCAREISQVCDSQTERVFLPARRPAGGQSREEHPPLPGDSP